MEQNTRSAVLANIQRHFIKNKLTSYLLLAVFCLRVYYPTFGNQFQNFWDDQWVVMNHYTEAGFTFKNFYAILSEFYHGQYAPVNQLFYTLIYKVFGYDAFWFHASCLLVHLLNVLLLFSFIEKLLKLSADFEKNSVWRISFFASLLFAIHPFLVEAVAWVSASKILLYSFFYLAALHCYLEYARTLKLRSYLITLTLFILSFGAKEQAVTFPVCIVLIDYALKRDFKNSQTWLEKLPLFIFSASFGVFTMLSQAVTGSGALSADQAYPFIQRIIFASYALFEYFFKCLLPYKLSYLYPFPNPVGQPVPMQFWPYPIALFAVIVCLWNFWHKRWIAFGMIFFLIHIAIALHILPISRFAIVADRYVYLASVGIFLVLAMLLDKICKISYTYRKAIFTLSFLYVFGIATYAHNYIRVWHDTDMLKKEIRQKLKLRKD